MSMKKEALPRSRGMMTGVQLVGFMYQKEWKEVATSRSCFEYKKRWGLLSFEGWWGTVTIGIGGFGCGMWVGFEVG